MKKRNLYIFCGCVSILLVDLATVIEEVIQNKIQECPQGSSGKPTIAHLAHVFKPSTTIPSDIDWLSMRILI